MTLLDSLLDAIVRLDGDALVMHVGEKPYVVTTSSAMNAYRGPLAWGQVELSSRVLTPDAVLSMVGQILPADQRHSLEDVGAVEHEIASPAGVPDRFTVVAARGGDDIWLELRRHPSAVEPPADAAQVSTAADVSEPAAAAPATIGQSASAVGLQEPPPSPPDVTSESRAPQEEEQTPPAPHVSEFAKASDAAELQGRHEEQSDEIRHEEQSDEIRHEEQSDEIKLEERVPVLDEVRHDDAEHVEHFVIPLTDTAREAESDAEAAMEIIEPEPQHAPTEEDVEAMLAATAASLLSANLKSDAPDADRVDSDRDAADIHAGFTPDSFEVVLEEELVIDEPVVIEEEGETESDLTSALDEMPAEVSAWLKAVEAAEAQSRQTPVDEPVPAAAEPSPESVESSPLAPPIAGAEAERTETPAEAVPVPETIEVPEPELPAAAADARVSSPSREPLELVPGTAADQRRDDESSSPTEISVDTTAALPVPPSKAPAHAGPKVAASPQEALHGGIVVPIGRATARPDRPDAGGRVDDERLLQMLRVAGERGATTVYVVAQSKPMVRVDGEIAALDDESVLTAGEIDHLVSALAPSRPAGTPVDAGAEWISEVPGVGRVRCVTFRDHRGPGLIFRLTSVKSISAEHLNLPPQIRELCTLADGLVLVAGARGSGKSTLLNSFVDLINRTRSEHVITVETEIGFVHESKRSFISQREAHDGSAAAAVTAAIREDPDVLVIEDVQSPEVAMAALHGAESGRLVFASINASSSASAIEAFVSMAPESERAATRAALSGALRAVVTQLVLRKASGGRVAARELLLNSPAVSASIRNGDARGVAAGLDAGERHGMVSLNESIAGLVRGGTVHAAEGYRRAPDRQALLTSLGRDGVDTSFAERLV